MRAKIFVEENLKDKLRKLAKAEMKKRNLIPKSSIITGAEMIRDVRTANKLPLLPEYFSSLDTKDKQEGAQAFYFISGSRLNIKTDSQLREVLKNHLGERIAIGGIVSGYSMTDFKILIEFPQLVHVVDNNDFDSEIIDSHLWLKLKECIRVVDEKSRTVSLGDLIIVEGTPYKYYSRGKEKYSLGDWGIVYSGIRSSKPGQYLTVKEDYLRIGWIFKLTILDSEKQQAQVSIRNNNLIKDDMQKLTEIFENRIILQKS